MVLLIASAKAGRGSWRQGVGVLAVKAVDALMLCLADCRGLDTFSASKKQLNQNWHGPGESDCLIKTKHCDGR